MKLKTTQIKNETTKELYNIFVNSGKFPNIKELLKWIIENLPNGQWVSIVHQHESIYYVDVEYKNTKGLMYPAYIQICFTVDIELDSIVWNSQEGNCFCRNLKWKQKLMKLYPKLDGFVHFYKPAKREKNNKLNTHFYTKTGELETNY